MNLTGDMQKKIESAAALLGERAVRDRPLGALTTFRIGGPAAVFVTVNGSEDLTAVRRAVMTTGVGVLVIGKGSNLLVADEGFAGVAVALGGTYERIEIAGDRVECGAAASLPVVARKTAAAALTGFEWAVGVPGSIGGAVRMNAGGHGAQLDGVLVEAELCDLAGGGGSGDGSAPVTNTGASPVWRPTAELGLGYRHSALTDSTVVLTARLALQHGNRDEAEQHIGEIVAWRRAHQPGGQNCGSVFTNPDGDSAGRLIEAAGLKGYRYGSAAVSEKHANFFQADPGGKAADMRALIRHVADAVEKDCGVRLRTEVRMVGW